MLINWRGWLSAALAVISFALVLPLATFLTAVWLLGWQLQSVQSGSMEPTYPVGSLLVTAAINPSDAQPGMAIVFEDPAVAGRLVAHRVVKRLDTDPPAFVTQGDANATSDALPVPSRLVRAQVLWHVPYLGSVMSAIQWPWSFVLLVVMPGGMLLVSEIHSRRRRPTTAPQPIYCANCSQNIVGASPGI
jgi:signal peptidase